MSKIFETHDIVLASFISYQTGVTAKLKIDKDNFRPSFTFVEDDKIKEVIDIYWGNHKSRLPLPVDKLEFDKVVQDHLTRMRDVQYEYRRMR